MSAVGSICCLSACGPKEEPSPSNPIAHTEKPPEETGGASKVTTSPTVADRLTTTLNADIAAPKNPYPEGTRLLSVKVDGTTAIVDLSSEFKKLGNMGSQGEGDAQAALIKCLAAAPEVKTMRVLVDGKIYEGEHSGEWNDIPLRDDKVAGGA